MGAEESRRQRNTKPCILGLSGKMKSGKTTIAQHLCDKYGFQRFSFATAVRREVARGMGMSLEAWNALEADNKASVRPILQAWGHGRRMISGENYWVAKVLEEIEGLPRVVIDDVRYPNELQAIRKAGGHVGVLEVGPDTQIERGANEEMIFHDSESALDDYFWVPAFIIETDFTDIDTVQDFVEWWLYMSGYLG